MSELHLAEALEAVDAATQICGDGKADVKRILTVLVNGKPRKETTYRTGQKIRVTNPPCEEAHLLASCGSNQVVAVYPNGSRCANAITVGDTYRITPSEIEKIMGYNAWELVEDDS